LVVLDASGSEEPSWLPATHHDDAADALAEPTAPSTSAQVIATSTFLYTELCIRYGPLSHSAPDRHPSKDPDSAPVFVYTHADQGLETRGQAHAPPATAQMKTGRPL
jgi:hypothetical protein